MKATAAEIAELESLALSRGGAVSGPAPTLVVPAVGPRTGPRGRLTRHEPGRLNKTEAAYALHLDARKQAGEIAGYWFEAIKFRLADRTWYSPDFLVQLADGTLEIHEVKGWMEDDAAVKLKVAASLYAIFVVRLVKRQKGKWIETVVSAN